MMTTRRRSRRRERLHACEASLFQAIRPIWRGTRSDLRRRIRARVRAHRRNPTWLRDARRRALCGPAAAIAILGFAAEAAHARAPVFDPDPPNPLATVDVGFFATPTLGDLDGDGDVDLLVGELFGSFGYFENVGTALAPSFTAQGGAANPLDGELPGLAPAAALADFDADGDLDLLVGLESGAFAYFENTGGPSAPTFSQRFGAANPLDGIDIGDRAQPSVGDLDADGDLDVLVGEGSGALQYFENVGSAGAASFVERTGSANPLDGTQPGPNAAPELVDADRDGDLDLLVGSSALSATTGALNYFENRGTAASASFVALADDANPASWLDPDGLPVPATADLDADGDADLLIGGTSGTIGYATNARGFAVDTPPAQDPTAPLSFGSRRSPAFGDLDADGDVDLVYEDSTGSFRYFENVGEPNAPSYLERTGASNPFDMLGFFVTLAAITLADVDGDADLDFFDVGGQRYFENVGNPSSPSYLENSAPGNPLEDLAGVAPISFGDLDGDGDLDAVSGFISVRYFENVGSATGGDWVERTGAANPFDAFGEIIYAAPTLADLDGDGDLDAAVVEGLGQPVRYFENVGDASSPVFVRRFGAQNPLRATETVFGTVAIADLDGDGDGELMMGSLIRSGFDPGFFENPGFFTQPPAIELTGALDPLAGASLPSGDPVLADFDADGDRDAVIGRSDGTLAYFENTRDVLAPLFTERTGPANPFDGIDVGSDAAPAVLDLEGDGDPDLVVGAADGTLSTLENTGSAGAPAFALLTGTNPLAAFDVGDAARVAIGDLDADGDPDVVSGESGGSLRYFENTGSRTSPSFTENSGASNPFDAISAAASSAPALADLEGDRDLDLTLGGADGTLAVFHNDGTATAPSFVEQVGIRSLFDGIDVGDDAQPGLGDFDGDGDPDVLVGEATGDVRVFRLPEPGRVGALASGLALLLGLVKRRRHRPPERRVCDDARTAAGPRP
ncbi:MAG: VCBS repeat-containing protein [Myxococcota bacterium]